jgi:hypothetical protein
LEPQLPAGRAAGRMVRCLAVLGEEVHGVFAEGQTLLSHFVQCAHKTIKGSGAHTEANRSAQQSCRISIPMHDKAFVATSASRRSISVIGRLAAPTHVPVARARANTTAPSASLFAHRYHAATQHHHVNTTSGYWTSSISPAPRCLSQLWLLP